MAYSAPVLEEVVAQMTNRRRDTGEGARVIPLLNPETGETDGLLLESLLERIALFFRAQDSLSLADISQMRRAMARGQARRAYLYVLTNTCIQNPVMLLATLSKIRIIRVELPEPVM